MYIRVRGGLGDAPSRAPWRVRAGLRPKPQYLAFLKLDQFDWNKASLTPRLREMVRHFAEHVKRSWGSMRPIAYIRLIGHTDNTGPDPKYNIHLGDQRARSVKEELEDILKEDVLKGRIRIAISVDPSPGASAPTADNRTSEGRALNRRVEVFVAPPEPSPESKKKPIITITEPPPPPVIQTTPAPYPWGKLPTLPRGKSFKQFVDEWLSDHHVPKLVRNQIWNAIFGKNFGVVSSLLDAAGISGPAKEAFVETVRGLTEAPTR